MLEEEFRHNQLHLPSDAIVTPVSACPCRTTLYANNSFKRQAYPRQADKIYWRLICPRETSIATAVRGNSLHAFSVRNFANFAR